MSRLWWQLPGPSRFVHRVVQDIRDGRNVVLRLPEYMAAGLKSAIRSALDREEWSWRTIGCNVREAEEPVQILFSRFCSQTCPAALWNADTLVAEDSFAGQLIWLDELDAQSWPAWKSFLEDYKHACRTRPEFERTLFFIPLVGQIALDPPLEDICLSHREWRGCVDLLDMLVFTTTLLQERNIPDLQKRVVASIIANIATWDSAVSEHLARESLENIFNPQPFLLDISRQRGWMKKDNGFDQNTWHKGMIDTFSGELKFHSAILALGDNSTSSLKNIANEVEWG